MARISNIQITDREFEPIELDLDSYLGDAWWIQSGSKKQTIKVLFKGEAATTIKEYKFHGSQKFKDSPDGTIVSWELSYLGEFCSWLCQWLGTFEVIEPQELVDLIDNKISTHQRLRK